MTTRPGDPRFYALLDQIAELHARKSQDYAPQADPLLNFRATADFGVRPYLGVLTRLRDKWGRICTFAQSGQLQNESARDSHIDSAVYHLLAVLLLEDEALPAADNTGDVSKRSHLSTSASESPQPKPTGYVPDPPANPRYIGEDGDPDHEWIGAAAV